MLMSLLPIGVMATDSITVYASVVQNGEFTTGKNNETMAYVPVTLDSESPTIDEAFTALHDTYYTDGANGYIKTDMGMYISITKFWGVTSSSVGYYNNNLVLGGINSNAVGVNLVLVYNIFIFANLVKDKSVKYYLAV